jgi:hypothetical protein
LAVTRPDHQDTERGSALVSALALVLVFATLAVLSLQIMLDTVFLDRQALRNAEADAAFSTAYSQALYLISSEPGVLGYGEIFTVETSAGMVELQVISPTGRVDINSANPILLGSLFEAAGALDAGALAAAVADWRDSDDLRALNGAERDAYDDAGLVGPANRAFRHENELALVLGMSPDVFECIRPHITVSTATATPDLRFASDWLRGAMAPGRDAVAASNAPPVILGSGDLIGFEMRLLDGRMAGRGLFVLVRLTGDPRDPIWVQAWDAWQPSVDACPGATT